jgi:tRNA modification GTPase
LRKVLCVANKADLPAAWRDEKSVEISAATGRGIDELRRRIACALDTDPDRVRERPALTNVRHIALVQRAQDALERAHAGVGAHGEELSEEFVLADLADARSALEEVAGRRTSEDLLAHIFERFCIGK